jgi:hypothetical protein
VDESMHPDALAKLPPLLRHAREIRFNVDVIESYGYFQGMMDGAGALRNLLKVADELEVMAAHESNR